MLTVSQRGPTPLDGSSPSPTYRKYLPGIYLAYADHVLGPAKRSRTAKKAATDSTGGKSRILLAYALLMF
jgi:hypothetical protein